VLFAEKRAPHLLTGYVQDIIAPIITATLDGEQKSFFTMQEYQETSKTCGSVSAMKYNKGIAPLTANEGKDHLFSSTRKHRILFAQSEEDSDALKRTFGGQSKRSCSIIGQTDELPPMKHDFFQNEYVRIADFAVQEVGRSFVEQRRRRSIFLLNALRQAQRKVMQGALWYTWDHTANVKRIASYVAQSTAYEHGEDDLISVIVRPWHKHSHPEIILLCLSLMGNSVHESATVRIAISLATSAVVYQILQSISSFRMTLACLKSTIASTVKRGS
jgi:hypothetical protein